MSDNRHQQRKANKRFVPNRKGKVNQHVNICIRYDKFGFSSANRASGYRQYTDREVSKEVKRTPGVCGLLTH